MSTTYVSAIEAARRLGVTAQHVRLLARQEKIAAKRDAHGHWVFPVDQIPAQPSAGTASRVRRPRRDATRGQVRRSGDQVQLELPVSEPAAATPQRTTSEQELGPTAPAAFPGRSDLEHEVKELRAENEHLRKQLARVQAITGMLTENLEAANA